MWTLGKKTARAALGMASMDVLVAELIAWRRPDRALRMATVNVGQTLCAYVFVSGRVPERAFAENIAPLPGIHILLRGPRYTVDAA